MNKAITQKDIDQAEDFLDELSQDDLNKYFEKCADKQPALFAYIGAIATNLQSDEHRSLFFDMSLVIWTAFEKKYPSLRELSMDEVEKADDEETEKLEQLASGSQLELLNESLNKLMNHPQQEVLSYVYTLLGEYFELGDEDETDGLDLEGLNENEITAKIMGANANQEDINPDDPEFDSGIISNTINTFVDLLEAARKAPTMKIVK